jgi:hypothetical protein
MVLADHLGKGGRPVFSGKHKIRHYGIQASKIKFHQTGRKYSNTK